jgi:hypothetical protein
MIVLVEKNVLPEPMDQETSTQKVKRVASTELKPIY